LIVNAILELSNWVNDNWKIINNKHIIINDREAANGNTLKIETIITKKTAIKPAKVVDLCIENVTTKKNKADSNKYLFFCLNKYKVNSKDPRKENKNCVSGSGSIIAISNLKKFKAPVK